VKIVITISIPSATGNSAQQIFCDFPAKNMREITQRLSDIDYLLVEQIFKDGIDNDGNIIWGTKGEVILNTMLIGKIQKFDINASENRVNRRPNTLSKGTSQ
jgi:hypothetical protein